MARLAPAPLAALFDGRFQDYFSQLLGGRALWLFSHVPKTAGTSLNGELLLLLKPAFHIFIDYTKVETRPYAELFDEAVDRFIAAAGEKDYRYGTGHIMAKHVARITAGVPDIRPITLLREPVARFISDYRYQRSTMNPDHAAFQARFPTIEPYLEQAGEWNKTAFHLIPDALREAGDAKACVRYLLQTYAFIGIQEAYPLTLRLMTTMAGSPQHPKLFDRANAPTAENPAALAPKVVEAIKRGNALDVAVYEDIAKRFTAMSAELEAYLDRVAPMGQEGSASF